MRLSSHGSSDPQLSVSNGALGLQQLTGEELSAALQASGIKRRVIVISACHAGAFIPPIKNPDTIIITAGLVPFVGMILVLLLVRNTRATEMGWVRPM